MTEWDEILRSDVSRRSFLTRMTAAGLGTAAAALLAGCGSSSRTVAIPTPTPTPGTTTFDPTNFPGIVGRSEDEVVLNYALTLETLEADLYRQALNIASGRSITDALDATVPASGSTGGYTQKVGNGSISSTFAFPAFLYLVQYAYVEAAHRDFLKAVLGSISGAPIAAANPKGYTAPFGTDLGSIMTLIQAVEEEGTRAYLGAAGKISNVVYLTAAAAIYSTECRHASAVAYILGKDSGPLYNAGDYNVINNTQTANPVGSVNTFQYYRLPTQVLADVKPFFVS